MSTSSAPGETPATLADISTRAEELSELLTHLQTSAETERATLAKELHDELGGLITAAKMDMAWLNAQIGPSLDPASAEKFKSVVQMLNQAMTLKRRVVESLRPSLLDHFGLAVALRSHFDERCGKAGLEYIATMPDDALARQPTVQLAMFRVAEEALTRVLGRGTAKHLELVIEADEKGYSMTIGDDGAQADAKLSQALTAMRHRVRAVGGTFDVEKAPEGPGGRVRVYVPRSPA